GMLVVWNPLEQERSATIALDLSFCGLAERVRVVAQGAAARNCELDRRGQLQLPVRVPAGGWTWVVFSAP
ncbi:MAG: hypothetical protein JNK49_09800, partial [Planctomycetes bacterium]|nr:hypothetical protein [Planctomycetota bacterium]